jgi:hypothetical protein
MSENLIHYSVPQEINYLAQLAGDQFSCDDFQHYILDSKVAFTAPTEATVISFQIQANLAFIITGVDIKTLYDTADAALNTGDFRSTFDLNPYGPYVGAGAVGSIRFTVDNEQPFATAYDIGVINAGVLFVFSGLKTLRILVNPFQPVGKNLTLVTRVNGYIAPDSVVDSLKKKETRIITTPAI